MAVKNTFSLSFSDALAASVATGSIVFNFPLSNSSFLKRVYTQCWCDNAGEILSVQGKFELRTVSLPSGILPPVNIVSLTSGNDETANWMILIPLNTNHGMSELPDRIKLNPGENYQMNYDIGIVGGSGFAVVYSQIVFELENL